MSVITERLKEIQESQSRQQPRQPAPPPPTAEAPAGGEDVRKARTRRLIQLGALTDQYLETAGMELEEAAELLLQLAKLPEVQHVIQNHK